MVTRPVRGTIITLTRHVPIDVPRTELPAKRQRVRPDVMLMRIVPCDLRGMERPAADAIRAADTVRDFLTVTVRGAVVFATVVVVVVSVLVVAGPGAEDVSVCAGSADGTVAAVVVVAEGDVVAVVVPTEEDGATVVVVVETVSDDTVTAADRSAWSFTPNWPSVFAPQHCTAPVAVTAHAWFAPVAMSSTVPDRPETAAGARTFAPEVPLPTWPFRLLPQHCTPPAVINAQA